MIAPTLLPLAIFFLVAAASGGLLSALFYGRLSATDRAGLRLALIAGPEHSTPGTASPDEKRRRHAMEETLRELDAKRSAAGKKKAKVHLALRMRQAGLAWSRQTYLAVCLGVGLGCFVLSLIGLGISLLPSIGVGLAGAVLIPNWFVNSKRNKRFAGFSAEFPNSLDVIIRGVKSGLPLSDCLKIIGAEAQEPVRGEFKAVVDDHMLGLPINEAMQRLPERLPVTEASFFAIVIEIQSRTGGSLAEALGNLARVLRERKKMRDKIKAVSSEAKASAGIIAALPVVVSALVYLTSPDYISLLFTTFEGNIILAVSGFWMFIGVLVMRKMINFDF